jgi:coenzyme F420 hydrogenase subunit beta
MLSRIKDNITFDIGRCVQCGTCLAACPHDALNDVPVEDGLWLISRDSKKCKRCFKCVAVCPAHGLPKKKVYRSDLDKILQLCLAHAEDQETRRKSSSGGAARVIAGAVLEAGIADAVYAVTKTAEYPWAKGQLWKQSMDISQLANSMYLPILVNKNMAAVKKIRSIFLIGTACQLLGAENLLKKRCERIFKVAIFCKQQKNAKLTLHMARRLGQKQFRMNSAAVEYRGGNWPGQVKIDGKAMKYGTASALPYGRRLWRVPGCRMCSNPFGEGADLTLSDPWGIDKAGELGNTLIAVWTEKGRELLAACTGKLKLEDIDKALLPKSVAWKDIRRKRILTDYYLGDNVSMRIRLAGHAERLQAALFEALLERARLPNIAYRIMARLPDLPDLFLGRKPVA